MTENAAPARRVIRESFETVAGRIPAIGRLMIIGKTDAVTHERIGPVERIERDGAAFLCRGECHDSRIDGDAVASMVIDTSSVMKEQVYPRIDFNGEDGTPVFSLVGFGGLEPFEAALAGLSLETLPQTGPKPERVQRPDVAEDDAGRVPLEAALASGAPIAIAYAGPGFSQRWTGTVAKVSPAMGFINVMTGDFHLHLPGGSVARWERAQENGRVVLEALNAEGRPIGLTLSAETEAAFVPSSQAAE